MRQYTRLTKSIFNEKLYDINKDVDFIYNKVYKNTIENIFKNKISIQQLDSIINKKFIIKSGELLSKDCIEANKVDPVVISCEYYNEEGTGYDALQKNNLIIITTDINLLYSIVENNYEYDLDLEDHLKNSIALFNKAPHKLQQYVEKDFKFKIAHELTHWVDDVSHGRFLLKRQIKANDIINNTLLKKETKDKLLLQILSKGKGHIYVSDTEINAMIHQISKLKSELSDYKWNTISLEQMLYHVQIFHTFKKIKDKIGREKFYNFQKQFLKRLSKEGLLGKNMNKLVLIETIENIILKYDLRTRS